MRPSRVSRTSTNYSTGELRLPALFWEMSMTTKARFRSRCNKCHGVIYPGREIALTSAERWVHRFHREQGSCSHCGVDAARLLTLPIARLDDRKHDWQPEGLHILFKNDISERVCCGCGGKASGTGGCAARARRGSNPIGSIRRTNSAKQE